MRLHTSTLYLISASFVFVNGTRLYKPYGSCATVIYKHGETTYRPDICANDGGISITPEGGVYKLTVKTQYHKVPGKNGQPLQDVPRFQQDYTWTTNFETVVIAADDCLRGSSSKDQNIAYSTGKIIGRCPPAPYQLPPGDDQNAGLPLDEPLFTALNGETLNTDGLLGENGEFVPSQENLFASAEPTPGTTDTFTIPESSTAGNLPLFNVAEGGLFTPAIAQTEQVPVADAGTTGFTFANLEQPAPGVDTTFATTGSGNLFANAGLFDSETPPPLLEQLPSFPVADTGTNNNFAFATPGGSDSFVATGEGGLPQLAFAPAGTLGDSQSVGYEGFTKRGIGRRVRKNRLD